jgi:hypothetical protein
LLILYIALNTPIYLSAVIKEGDPVRGGDGGRGVIDRNLDKSHKAMECGRVDSGNYGAAIAVAKLQWQFPCEGSNSELSLNRRDKGAIWPASLAAVGCCVGVHVLEDLTAPFGTNTGFTKPRAHCPVQHIDNHAMQVDENTVEQRVKVPGAPTDTHAPRKRKS